MRVCIIHSIFPPYSRGGAEVVVEATAQAFAQAGHEIFVITCAPFAGWGSLAGKWEKIKCNPNATDKHPDPRMYGSVDSDESVDRDYLRIFRFTPLNLFTIFNLGKYPALLRLIWHVLDMFNLHTYLVVRKILIRERPDLIITRNLKGLGYTVPLVIRRYTPKWFHGLHDLGALHPRGFMEWGKENAIHKPNFLVRLYRACARYLFGSPDVVVAPSQFVLDEYNCAGFFPKSKKVVVPNPVIYNPPSPSLILREGVARFLYVGQLEPYKGVRVLITAWKEFIAQHPDAVLEIIGTGSLVGEVRRASQGVRGIIYRGAIAHDKLAAVMSGARGTIMPSLAYETFGMTAAESLVQNVPVIASRIGALPEFIQNNQQGILVKPGDAAALQNALEHMAKAPLRVATTQFMTPAQYCAALEKLAKA